MEIKDIAYLSFKEAVKNGADDISVLCTQSTDNQIRFSNNSITVIDSIKNLEIALYLSKDKKRIIGATNNPSNEEIKKFIQNLLKVCVLLSPSDDYVPLPKIIANYPMRRVFIDELNKIDEYSSDLVKMAIDSALEVGASRVSGSFLDSKEEVSILTTSGAEGDDINTKLLLNLRAFSEEGSSGHGISCAGRASDIDPIEAGNTAGNYAISSKNPRTWEEGIYDLVVLPTVAADIIQHLGSFSSAFTIDTGLSFFTNKINSKIAVEELTLRDQGIVEGGFGGRVFDDEGIPTSENIIIKDGILKNYLHNNTTARKFNTSSTGNAGIIEPHPWNLLLDQGNFSFEELVQDVHRGILVTNNWYTRFHNLRKGDYSTLPRDATFLIENGEIKNPIKGLRISDNILRQISDIKGISKDRKWIEWWEVTIPTLSPSLLIKDVTITKAGN